MSLVPTSLKGKYRGTEGPWTMGLALMDGFIALGPALGAASKLVGRMAGGLCMALRCGPAYLTRHQYTVSCSALGECLWVISLSTGSHVGIVTLQ